MTLICRFALKSGSSSSSNGLAFLAFGKNCSDICRAKHRLSAAKNVAPHCTGDISVIGLFAGVPLRESVKQVNCIDTQFSDVLFTDIDKKAVLSQR